MKDHYYFDNASTSWPKPELVYTTMDREMRTHGVNPGRSGYSLALEAEQLVLETRKNLAEFFNCPGDANRLVFTQNATDSLNIALFGVLREGDHVVTTRIEHNSVLRPLKYLEQDFGVSVTYVGHDAQGYVDPEDIRLAITSATRMIVINHGSNVIGTVQDLTAIGNISREAGTLFVVDTCQTAGVLAIDCERDHIDILTFTGHKGLFGPMGIGGMYVLEGVDIRPVRFGGTGVDSISPYQPESYPHHLEAGTISVPGIAGLNGAQQWFAELGRELAQDRASKLSHREACSVALQAIHDKEMGHTFALEQAFRALEGVTVYGPTQKEHRVATLSINVDALPAEQVGEMLDADYHICVRTGLHCAPLVHQDAGTVEQGGTVRFSPGYFTQDEDIAHAINAITEIAKQG
ncbi:MAG: aminotransferase class V-fold PLP-dependent enzyme [Gammaproteobacteria bacterium]|nr:aminotransferase class V-fold PLP-dependent enzyme [Gammaproteobacteria bacterium]